jgi:IgA Peptidase M64/Peptidase M64 N-terminus
MHSTHVAALVAVISIACASIPAAPVDVAHDAPVLTMRLDYFHRGGPGGETVTLDRVANDGAWPGSRTALIDETGLGKYFFDVADELSGRTVYSRGFDSIYGEWETTPEFRVREKVFHESLRFPWPRDRVRITLRKRNARNVFTDLWSTTIDPRVIDREPPNARGRVSTVIESGPADRKVDLLLISEGYRSEEMPKFREAATRLLDALFALEPFNTRRSDFNVRLLEAPGRMTSVEFNVFGIERYAVTYANRNLRNLAASAPYDALVIIVNESKYGGGGIFNQQSTVAAGNASAGYVFIHELAHNLAGLADEYVGNVTYETGSPRTVEPWEPNLTALLDVATLKWRDLVRPGTPIPTPMTYAGRVGAFEGGGYEARGLYRPEAECIMGSRKMVPFCRVCQRAISRIIDLHSR